MTTEEIDISPLIRARDTFERFRKDLSTDKDKAATVQAFEFTYELAWTSMKRALESQAIEANFPKDVFRKAALWELIYDPEIWFEFSKIRNKTVHTYNPITLEEVVSVFELFSSELDKLIEGLKNLK